MDTAKVCLLFAEENINNGLYRTTTFSLGSYISKLANQGLNNYLNLKSFFQTVFDKLVENSALLVLYPPIYH